MHRICCSAYVQRCTGHPQAYEDWLGGVEGTQVPYDQCGQMMMVKVTTQWGEHQVLFSLIK